MGNEHGKAAGGSSKSSSGESKSAAAGVSESKTPNVSLVQGSANQYQPKIVESDYFNRTNLKMANFSTRSDGFAPALTMDFSKQFEFAVSSSDDGECTAIRVERYIASGGFAHVFLCRKVLNDGLGEVFAAKFMYKRGDKELSKLAKRSMQGSYWTAGSTHKNVIHVVDFRGPDKIPAAMGRIAKFGYVILELGHLGEVTSDFILGDQGTGRQMVEPLAEPYLKRITRDILEGLKFMHDRGVRHQDLKPENFLIDVFGRVKITDFGLILTGIPRVVRDGNNTSTVFTPKGQGSVSYMSPEMKKGVSTLTPNEATDIWSVGMSILLMAAAALPEETFADKCQRDPKHPFKWLRRKRCTISDDFKDFLEQIFRIPFASVSQRDKMPSGPIRATATELLAHPWLADCPSDEAFARELVRRNPSAVERGIANAPQHSLCFVSDSWQFFAVLVGCSYKKKYGNNVGEQHAGPFLKTLGMTGVMNKYGEEVMTQSLDTFFEMSIENDITEGEERFLARALSAAGLSYDWIADVYPGAAALRQALA